MHDHDPQPWQCDDCGQMNIGPFCECVIDHGEQPNLRPWQCDDCGRVNSPDSPVCRCYFWDDETIREIDNWAERHREPAPDLSHWLTVSIQEEESPRPKKHRKIRPYTYEEHCRRKFQDM